MEIDICRFILLLIRGIVKPDMRAAEFAPGKTRIFSKNGEIVKISISEVNPMLQRFAILLGGPDELTWFSVLLRLLLATLFGCTLGVERTRKGRAAGMRTYGLVSAGAALVIMTGEFVSLSSSFSIDPTRMAAQVISGIGFLGAGTILLTARHKVTGLTTAAGLWASACIGLAVGVGFYLGALAAYIISFILIALCDNYRAYLGKKTETLNLFVLLENKRDVPVFISAVRKAEYELFDLTKADADMIDGIGVTCALRRENYKHFDRREAIEFVQGLPGVVYAEEAS